MYSTEILLKLCDERNRAITAPSYKQTNKQTLTTSKRSIEFTYSDFTFNLKVNRDKFASINRRGSVKRAKVDDCRNFTHEY